MTIGSIAGRIRNYGRCGANFILGTGADTIGESVKKAVLARKDTSTSLFKAIGNGFGEGFKATNAVAKEKGFFRPLWDSIKGLPKDMGEGWKGAVKDGKGLFGKIGKSLKPVGKILPFAFNALFLLSSVPSVVARAKDEGVWGGVKEAAKAIAKMGVYAVGIAVGAAFGPVGSFACAMGIGMLGDMILGPDYKTKKAQEAEKVAEAQQAFEQIKAQNVEAQGQKFSAVA